MFETTKRTTCAKPPQVPGLRAGIYFNHIPAGPILVRPGCRVEAFADLAALGRRVQVLRGAMGLQRRARVFSIRYCGTLQGHDLIAFDRDTGGEIWIGTAWAGEAVSDAVFEAAVKAQRPDRLGKAAA